MTELDQPETLTGVARFFYEYFGKDADAARDLHQKHFENAYRMLFQLTIVFLSGWVTLVASGKLLQNSQWHWAIPWAVSIHVFCLIALCLNSFLTFVSSSSGLNRQLKFFESVADFHLDCLLGKQMEKESPDSIVGPLSERVEKWRAHQGSLARTGQRLRILVPLVTGVDG